MIMLQRMLVSRGAIFTRGRRSWFQHCSKPTPAWVLKSLHCFEEMTGIPPKIGFCAPFSLAANLRRIEVLILDIYQVYDRVGRPCSPALDRRTLAVELETLKQKKLSIAIAGSLHKVNAILGILQGQYCNVLITDEDTAKALLS